jgi:hypothetical protein
MDKQKEYISLLGGLLMLIVVSMTALGEARLEVYLSLFTVCYFAATALYRPRKRYYDIVGAALFLVFMIIVSIKVLEIIT